MATNLTPINATFNASGKFGYSLNGGYATGVVPASLMSGTITLTLWVKTTSDSTQVAFGSRDIFWVGIQSGFAVAKYGNSVSYEVAVGGNIVISDGLWHHIAFVLSSSGSKLFIDGALSESKTTTYAQAEGLTTTTNPFAIRDFGGIIGSYSWEGGIDDVALYSTEKYTTAFTPPTSPASNTDTGLVSVWHLDNNVDDSYGVIESPTVTTDAATSISTATATSGGNVTSDGGATVTTRGVCWSTSQNPTTANSKTTDGAGTGVFTSSITGLTTGQTYYVRAYATNSAGTSYGSQISFVAQVQSNTISPDNANIVYSPYNWKVTNSVAKTINAGAYLRMLFTGNSITINSDLTGLSAPYSQLWYRIDGYGGWTLVTNQASIVCEMPTETSSWEAHLLELVVKSTTEVNDRWNTQSTAIKITSFVLEASKTTVAMQKSDKNIIFYGDSITEGVRTIAINATYDLQRNDAAQTWNHKLAELLGCEFGNIGFGATKYSGSGNGNVPKLASSYNYLWSGEARDFATIKPDMVIANMGTNDGSTDTVTEITNFLNGILSQTGSYCKIVMLRPFNGNQAANIQTAIATCTSPTRCVYVDTTGLFTSDGGDGLHPFGYMNTQKIAPSLANTIRPYLYGESHGSTFTPKDFWDYMANSTVVAGSMMERILNTASEDFVGESLTSLN